MLSYSCLRLLSILWSLCLLILCPVAQSLDVQCTITAAEPTTCYITTPIYLLPGSTLNIVNTSELINVKRFELRAFTNLNRIPPILFAVFPSLEEIVMANYAQVATLTATDLLYASKLKVLNLSGNKLEAIPYSTFALAPSLQLLDLSANLITEIEPMAFRGLEINLKQLDLSFNRLSTLDAFSFTDLANLEVLNLNNNKIKLIGDGAFGSLPKLRILNFNSNSANMLPNSLFGAISGHSPPLTYVDFGENKLTHIGTSLYTLQELNLLNLTANKKIDDINLEALAQLPKLETLLLSNSGFQFPTVFTTITPPEAVANTPVPISNSPLKKLYLAKNKLANPDVFRQLAYFRQLEVLSLEENRFTLIDNIKSLPTWFPSLRTIYLGENKLNCVWLNDSIPVFQSNNINVFTIKKTKTWFGTTTYEQKLIDMDDCVDLDKILGNILFFLNKFGKAAL